MALIHGRNIKILDGGATGTPAIIAAAKSCTISKTADTIEKASATQQSAKEYIAGRTGWEVSLSHLVTSDAPFDGVLKVGNTYTLRIDIGSTTQQGTAICTQADIAGTVGNLATGNVKFLGSGELSSPVTT